VKGLRNERVKSNSGHRLLSQCEIGWLIIRPPDCSGCFVKMIAYKTEYTFPLLPGDLLLFWTVFFEKVSTI
jgi:hypothetical protein